MTELNTQDQILEPTDDQLETAQGGIYISEEEPLKKVFFNTFFPTLLNA